MSKAFVKDDGEDDEPGEAADALPPGTKNYITPTGHAALKDELAALRAERREVVNTVAWAAGNGDRSENADYLYGKRRLREIDRRVRFLLKRLELAEVVDPARQQHLDRIYFGATVTYVNARDEENTLTIVGVDEAGRGPGLVSWISPIARALRGARAGDVVKFRTPGGAEEIEILAVSYGDQGGG
jgi:transcription elongation factor GreB